MVLSFHRISFSVIIPLILVIAACDSKDHSVKIAYQKVNDSLLDTHQGVTYYRGKPFTGNAFAVDENKDTVLSDIYFEGRLNGESKAWYTKGKLMHQRFYKNGQKQGAHKLWWPNGNLKSLFRFKDDEYNGELKEWYENGAPFRTFTYTMGHEEGPQKMWRIDGSVYANYFVKNNRIYGLSGRKNCKNLEKK